MRTTMDDHNQRGQPVSKNPSPADSVGLGSRAWNVSTIALALGVLSVLSALAVAFVAYRSSIQATEHAYHRFYMDKARRLTAAIELQGNASDRDVLSRVESVWKVSGEMPLKTNRSKQVRRSFIAR